MVTRAEHTCGGCLGAVWNLGTVSINHSCVVNGNVTTITIATHTLNDYLWIEKKKI
ncbi:hypothetical protein DPMN_011720 [Dreissena polymorpha]|uniref:Uncharacterized protein n=1 Tax=Dreissena polymorpha TaxID=45954 RepID=A0A9D4S0K5_DREPO|nr:hypothetical protein DPMN_011720 [Dreissena polymorpha]